MKNLWKWLCRFFEGYDIKLMRDDIHCTSDDLTIYIGKYTSPCIGYIGSIKYKDRYEKFECTTQDSVKRIIKNVYYGKGDN